MGGRIVYIKVIFSKDGMSGVFNKTFAMAREFNKAGVDYVVFNRVHDGVINGVRFINVDIFWSRWFVFLNKFFRYLPLVNWLNHHGDKYELIYLRYPLFDFSSFMVGRKNWNKIVTEHHSKELLEIPKLSGNRAVLYGQYICERLFGRINLSKTLGLTGVTNDIVKYELSRISNSTKPSHVFSNGVDLNDFKFKYPNGYFPKKEARDCVQFVFMASRFCAWHGLDRLWNSLIYYRSDTPIVINIIGEVSDELAPPNSLDGNVTIRFHGVLKKEQVAEVIGSCDVAIDSLALDRLSFTESSTLKAKEYMAIGLPIVGSVPDVDVKGLGPDYKGFFKVEVNEDRFCMDDVVHWYLSIFNSDHYVDMLMRARESVGWHSKVEKLIKFFDGELIN